MTIVMEHLVRAWAEAFPQDRISVLFGPEGQTFPLPDGAHAEVLAQPGGPIGGLWLRSVAVRRAARRLGADAVLAAVPASGLLGSRSPRGVILYDLRFELRPEQFSRRTRVARKVSWLWSMRLADRIFTISDRTLHDLADLHPSLSGRARTAALGSDHALAWPQPDAPDPEHPYAIAFGHYGNKNANAVIDGWAQFCAAHSPEADGWRLRLVGMGARDRAAAEEQVRRLGVGDRIELMPWLDDDAFARAFAGARLVVFPSDFEGFGLPAAEAIRLGIPAVISTDPALAEVTGGHAVTAVSTTPADLAKAFETALALTPEQLAAGRAFAEAFTWRRTAAVIRAGLS
ncbi:glycosyltransferase [Nocardioides kongjuensis]|uniref:Glycosyltransferase involved in cell wall biosynthesis n=1 Tax=Nocardioides kongjuensis TaxID=349522 RepID=A0A852RD80_9ACTN|nr:glycosyltransferase involved in cell wall biosynthesis [Nocardioides kongjuensis]